MIITFHSFRHISISAKATQMSSYPRTKNQKHASKCAELGIVPLGRSDHHCRLNSRVFWHHKDEASGWIHTWTSPIELMFSTNRCRFSFLIVRCRWQVKGKGGAHILDPRTTMKKIFTSQPWSIGLPWCSVPKLKKPQVRNKYKWNTRIYGILPQGRSQKCTRQS